VKLALVTAAEAHGLDEDLPLLAALARLGARTEPVAWDDPSTRWTGFDAAVIRSASDHARRRDAFVEWARALPIQLFNSAEIVAWNSDKRYLAELAAQGIPIVPTTWIAPSTTTGEAREALELPSGEIVIKPAISAGSREAARYLATEHAAATTHLHRLSEAGRLAMVQPYQSAADAEGATALLFFGGVYSHAIRRRPLLSPAIGVTEVSPEEERPHEPSAKERAVAEAVLDAVPMTIGGRSALAYARVDLVPSVTGPLLLELELTEPSMFSTHAPRAPDRLAAALLARLR
jgi:glutathione synthase/RimK-type ligase-like ATP-grasp enzyme